MPRGDGTGPWGTGPIGRGRGGCQQAGLGLRMGAGYGRSMLGFGRGAQCGFGFANNTPMTPETLESQAERLESQAAKLRDLAKNRKPE